MSNSAAQSISFRDRDDAVGAPVAPIAFQMSDASSGSMCRSNGSPNPSGRWLRSRALVRRMRFLIPVGVLVVLATLFVLGDIAAQHFFPHMSIGWHHAMLTSWAGVVTAGTCGVVYLVMRRHQAELSRTARSLSRLLESYESRSSVTGHFENPHLVRCRDVLDCHRVDCPMHDAPDQRCWQVRVLNRANADCEEREITLQQCYACKVYRLSCPDPLTELGESFNNLMYLLNDEAQQLGLMQAQMMEKEKMVAIGQMAAGVAHEVGNPLSSISSIVQMLKRVPLDSDVTENLDLIERHVQRISTTVRQLGKLARPGGNHWERIDLQRTLADAVQLIRFDPRAKNVEVDFPLPKSLPASYGLRGQLQQVFINIALNALDAMSGGGRLTIRAQKNHRNIVVTFKDTGCGIAPETGRRIFEPFFTTKEPGAGTGLGLSVSYGMVQKHGGTIEFKSNIGKGTTFTVQLPILDQPPDS